MVRGRAGTMNRPMAPREEHSDGLTGAGRRGHHRAKRLNGGLGPRSLKRREPPARALHGPLRSGPAR